MPRRRRRTPALSPALLLATLASACAPSAFEGTIDDAATGPRVAGIERIRAEDRRSGIPQLVECLASNDPVVRADAIRALRAMTGETHGYQPEAPPLQRKAAVDRWVEWCRANGLVAPTIAVSSEAS